MLTYFLRYAGPLRLLNKSLPNIWFVSNLDSKFRSFAFVICVAYHNWCCHKISGSATRCLFIWSSHALFLCLWFLSTLCYRIFEMHRLRVALTFVSSRSALYPMPPNHYEMNYHTGSCGCLVRPHLGELGDERIRNECRCKALHAHHCFSMGVSRRNDVPPSCSHGYSRHYA